MRVVMLVPRDAAGDTARTVDLYMLSRRERLASEVGVADSAEAEVEAREGVALFDMSFSHFRLVEYSIAVGSGVDDLRRRFCWSYFQPKRNESLE